MADNRTTITGKIINRHGTTSERLKTVESLERGELFLDIDTGHLYYSANGKSPSRAQIVNSGSESVYYHPFYVKYSPTNDTSLDDIYDTWEEGRDYIGVPIEEPDNYTDKSQFKWAKFKGEGVFIKFSSHSNGSLMTDVQTNETTHLGIMQGSSASKNPSDYDWFRIVADKIFIKYSKYPNGKNGSVAEMVDTWTNIHNYIGIATVPTNSSIAPSDPDLYKWSTIRGESAYIRYSEHEDGHDMTTTWSREKIYIGINTNFSPSNNYKDYQWSRFCGDSVYVRYSLYKNGRNEDGEVRMSKELKPGYGYMGIANRVSNSEIPEYYEWALIEPARQDDNGYLYFGETKIEKLAVKDLYVEKATEIDTLKIKDNIIETNSGKETLTTLSGLAINTDKNVAYGIVYDPASKSQSVKLGLGQINQNGNFEFVEEGNPIATRAQDNELSNNNVLKWDSENYRLIDSGYKAGYAEFDIDGHKITEHYATARGLKALETSLDGEIATINSTISQVEEDLATETSTREAAISNIEEKITETEKTINTNITNLSNSNASDHETINANINSISTTLNTEIIDRTNAEKELKSNIEAETSAREKEDSNIKEMIQKETEDRTSAIKDINDVLKGLNAEQVYFRDNLLTTVAIGNITLQNGQATIEAKDKNLKQVWNTIFVKEKNPVTTQPSVSITLSGAGAKEVGTIVTPSWSAKLSAGSYTYGPATGVVASSWQITNTIENTATTEEGSFQEFQVTESTNYKITAIATYADGAVPKTNIGNDYAAGQIKAGSKSATSSAITGYRAWFCGYKAEGATIDVANITSAQVRALGNSANGSFKTSIPATKMQQMFFAAPTGKVRSIAIVDSAKIPQNVFKKTVSVEGANSFEAATYDLFYVDNATAASGANTYTITVTKA